MVWLDLLDQEDSQGTEDFQGHLDQMENLYVWSLISVVLAHFKNIFSVSYNPFVFIQGREFSEEFIRQVCTDVLRSKFQRILCIFFIYFIII